MGFAGVNVHRNLGVITPGRNLDAKYLNFYLTSDLAQAQIRKKKKGGNQSLLNLEDVKGIIVVVPPRAEQTRIAQEIDRRVSVLAEFEVELDRNSRRAKRLRESVLRHAFSGRLNGETQI